MGRTAGRTPEQTRRALLDAAAAAIRSRGAAATLGDIAREAGVSKGGLLYHFATKDELVVALAEDEIAVFREAVEAALDPDDRAPGRLTRAYVRASFESLGDDTALRAGIALTAQLMTIPEIAALARADAERWDEELSADGLPEEVTSLVVAAADGACIAPLFGGSTATPAHARLREHLLRLTYPG